MFLSPLAPLFLFALPLAAAPRAAVPQELPANPPTTAPAQGEAVAGGSGAPSGAPAATPDGSSPQGAASPGASQGGSQTEFKIDYSKWQTLNRVDRVVNTSIVTRRAIGRQVAEWREIYPIQTQRDVEEAAGQAAMMLSQQALWVQAGRDMGLEKDIIQRSVDRLLEEEQGTLGTLGRAQSLQAKGYDRRDEQEAARDDLYANWYRASVAGYAPGPGGRQIVDTFLRPGQLQAIYEQYPELFREPDTVVLQVLVVTGDQAGSLEDAKQIVGDFREKVLLGTEDFDDVCTNYSAVAGATAGRLEPMLFDELLDPGHRDFILGGASIGDFSQVLPFYAPENPGVEVVGYQLVRVADRSSQVTVRPFVDRDIQRAVNNETERILRDQRLRFASAMLARDSFLWPQSDLSGGR